MNQFVGQQFNIHYKTITINQLQMIHHSHIQREEREQKEVNETVLIVLNGLKGEKIDGGKKVRDFLILAIKGEEHKKKEREEMGEV